MFLLKMDGGVAPSPLKIRKSANSGIELRRKLNIDARDVSVRFKEGKSKQYTCTIVYAGAKGANIAEITSRSYVLSAIWKPIRVIGKVDYLWRAG